MTASKDGFIDPFTAEAAARPTRLFARFNGAPMTFGELDRLSDAVAATLRRIGVRAGDRVAVMMRNSPLAVAIPFGFAKASVVWVAVNAQQRGEGLRYVLEHSEPRLIVADGEFVEVIKASGAAAPVVAADEAFAARPLNGAGFAEALPAADAPFVIMYTSGTTGRPKGVVVSHRMMRLAGEGVALVAALRPGDVMFMWEPLYHIGGAQVLIVPLLREVSLALVDRFSASRFWSQTIEHGATHIHYLGGILQILLKQPERREDRGHKVRIAWGGGCPADIWMAFQDRFGVEIRECYGMTEASSITTYNDSGTVGAVGRPVPWFTVELLDASGAPVASGERGEIVVRTSRPGAIFPGYFHNPEATARALRNGALHTGDLGSFDAAGNLVFHGRMTDSVRCRGENVSAWEVEHVAAAHPAVEDCAMIGVPAEIGEQDIKLFVKPRSGAAIDLAALSSWLTERLAPYQNPRYLAAVEEFERTPSQRIMKHRLSKDRDDCWDRLASDRAQSPKA